VTGTSASAPAAADNRPVIIGVGQYTHRIESLNDVREPVDLLEEALRTALDDTGSSNAAGALEQLGVVQGLWSYPDPGRTVLDRVGAGAARSFTIEMGGNMLQAALLDAANQIAAGSLQMAAVSGTEAHYSRKKLKAAGEKFAMSGTDLAPGERWGPVLDMENDHEEANGFDRPFRVYSLFESALRSAAGRSVDDHRAVLGDLWSRFSAVASSNPHAWTQRALTSDEVAAATAANRMVSFPYTKSMIANPAVNQAAVIVLASAGKARELGVPADRCVFIGPAASANDTLRFSNRNRFDESPAVDAIGTSVMARAEMTANEFDHIDLYSCFPSMVQISAKALGLPLDRDLTVTGGLSFFGGPLNSYVAHAIVSTVERLRADPATTGLVHGNGGFCTKHNLVAYAGDPDRFAYGHDDLRGEVDLSPRHVDEAFTGTATIESATVVHDRDTAPLGLATLLADDGARALAQLAPGDALELEQGEPVGRRVDVDSAGLAHL